MAAPTRPPARKRLTETVIESVHREIGDGTWRPGEKLPTEQALIERFGVSRTVVREAIAALRADGVLESRHGVGFFVLDRMAAHGAARGAATRVSEIVEELELRAAVEIEAAGLAALRASPGQEIEIHDRYRQFAALVRNGEPTVVADFAFHMAIARATNNPRFERFLSELGRRTIPREQLRSALGTTAPVPNRDDQLDTEHRAVAEAIGRHDASAARDAMRSHLLGSLERYRALARQVVLVEEIRAD